MGSNIEAVKVLDECKALMLKKSNDYQNPDSAIVQADYYPRGLNTLLDIAWGKVLRMRSVAEAMEKNPSYQENFESIEDSAKDLINYCAFIVSYSRGKIPGQNPENDCFNRPIIPPKSITD